MYSSIALTLPRVFSYIALHDWRWRIVLSIGNIKYTHTTEFTDEKEAWALRQEILDGLAAGEILNPSFWTREPIE